jgi:hypothetical protein
VVGCWSLAEPAACLGAWWRTLVLGGFVLAGLGFVVGVGRYGCFSVCAGLAEVLCSLFEVVCCCEALVRRCGTFVCLGGCLVCCAVAFDGFAAAL